MRPQISARFPSSKVNAADGRGAYNGGVNGDPGPGLEAIRAEVVNVDSGGWMVVELGSNNISMPSPNRIWFITEVANAVPNDRCIAWVTPYVAMQEANVSGWVTDLQATLPLQPCHVIVRWDLAAAAHPEYLADFVHPNDLGKAALLDLIATSIGMP
jgi:hypothetical protein